MIEAHRVLALVLAGLASASFQEGEGEEVPEPATGEAQEEVEVGAEPPAVEDPAPEVGADAPEAPQVAGEAPDGVYELLEGLRELARAYPQTARVEVLGHGREGQEIALLMLTAGADGGVFDRPAMVIVEESGRSEARARWLLELAARILERSGQDPRIDELLARCVLLFAPIPDPDALTGRDEGVRFARNFPIGWSPGTLVEGAGLQPLSEPASLAFATLLLERSDLALILGAGVDQTRGAPFPGSELPTADARLMQRLTAGLEDRLATWATLASTGGSLLDQAYQGHGVPSVVLAPPVSGEVDASLALILELEARLPRLAFEHVSAERIGSGIWRIDLELVNPGRMPTLTHLARERRVGGVVAEVQGARLVASARGNEPGPGSVPSYAETAFHAGRDDARVPLGTLDGGARLHLRLVVAAESETLVRITARAPRAGAVVVDVQLGS